MRFDDINDGNTMSLYDAMVIGLNTHIEDNKHMALMCATNGCIRVCKKDMDVAQTIEEAMYIMANELLAVYKKEYDDNH